MALAIYGKHPAKGDFLEAGLPPALRPAIEGWLDAALAAAREVLGPQWPAVWSQAPMLRFWIGEAAFGEVVAGVMAPTQDRVGRRFPLVALATGADAPPPPVAGDAGWHDAVARHLTDCLGRKGFDHPSALLGGLVAAEGEATAVASPDFWAVRPGGDAAALWADVAPTDQRHAAAGRSFWWVTGEEPTPAAEDVEAPDDTGPATPATDEGPVPPENASPADAEATETPAEEEPVWDLPPDDPATDASPFGEPDGGLGLFAAPEPGMAAPVADVEEPAAPPPGPRPPLWSQVWAGAGLPSGPVLAWFFRGHAGNV